MPLIEGKSEASLQKNIATEIEAGKDPKQAAAIACSVQRKAEGHDNFFEEPGVAVDILPEDFSPADINRMNEKYWNNK